MGFLPQHVKMTNLFEQAMQAVDPSVALPYWDFTIDSESGTVVQDSTVFSDYMFGSIPVPVNNRLGFVYSNDNITAAAIPDGRWAYIKADLVPSKFEGTQLSAAYGEWVIFLSITCHGSTAMYSAATFILICENVFVMSESHLIFIAQGYLNKLTLIVTLLLSTPQPRLCAPSPRVLASTMEHESQPIRQSLLVIQ